MNSANSALYGDPGTRLEMTAEQRRQAVKAAVEDHKVVEGRKWPGRRMIAELLVFPRCAQERSTGRARCRP
jgi:hypothetical protein